MSLITVDLNHRSSLDAAASPKSYSTTFSGGTETTLSEGGVWTTGSSYQPACQMASGLCWGKQTGNEVFTPVYNDSQAFLSGFNKNHGAELTINLGSVVGDLEVEILLGAKFGSVRHVGSSYGDTFNNDTDFDGIEVNLGFGKYGVFGAVYRFLDGTADGENFDSAYRAHDVQNGDKLRAQLVLNDATQKGVVTCWMVRGATTTLIGTTSARSAYYRIGNPGIAFFRENDSNGSPNDPTQFCATAFSAWDLP